MRRCYAFTPPGQRNSRVFRGEGLFARFAGKNSLPGGDTTPQAPISNYSLQTRGAAGSRSRLQLGILCGFFITNARVGLVASTME